MMNQRLGRVSATLRCYERFLVLVPEGGTALRARMAMDELGAQMS